MKRVTKRPYHQIRAAGLYIEAYFRLKLTP